MMKAIVVKQFGGPEVLQLKEIETPVPADGEVLVKVKAVGINPVETYQRSGNHANAPKLPFTPGKDAAGIVEGVGGRVTRFAVGDRVVTANSISGSYAEYTLCREADLISLPEGVSFEQGAGVWTPYATSYRALFQRGRAKEGETVLIHGASGGVGTAAVQWAENAGLTVIGTAGSEQGKELVKQAGADLITGHLSADGVIDEIKQFCGGVDLIIEMLANENLETDFEVLKMFGRIVVVGNRGTIEFTPRLTMTKDADVLGMSLFNTPADKMDEIKAAIFDGLREGYLSPFVGEKFTLSDAAKAHHAVIENKAFGKIVLTV